MNIITENRKAYFNYTILEEIEAGIVLQGSEVKSLRQNSANMSDAYVIEKNMELWLQNMHIAEYKGAHNYNHPPKRARKLLVKSKQIAKLAGNARIGGLTMVPLLLYFNDSGRVKIRIALVKGKKTHDKRSAIKKREGDIYTRRAMKGDIND